jgi:hypothetical protein
MRLTKMSSFNNHAVRIIFSIAVFLLLGYVLIKLNSSIKYSNKEGFSVTDASIDMLNKISDKADKMTEPFAFINEFTNALTNIPKKLMEKTIKWTNDA